MNVIFLITFIQKFTTLKNFIQIFSSYKMEKRKDCTSYPPLACSIDYKQYEEIVLASRRHLMFITCVHQVYQFFQNGDCHS